MSSNIEKNTSPRNTTTTESHQNNEKKKYFSPVPDFPAFADLRFEKICGFRLTDFTSSNRFTTLLYQPTDAAGLGVVRALFGLCMVLDVVEERGLADVDLKWGDPMECHFPLIHGMRSPTLPFMIVVFAVMWAGAFGIMLGFYFKLSCACFVIPYWYIFLLDKSYWNNHTYLYGIVATLFWGTGANKYFALDAKKFKQENNLIPWWNYFILRFQFFALYFIAGLKKSEKEWLEGYAMANLSHHWVFTPFTFFLTTEQTDFLIVHWFAFIFDLTVGFWMLFEKTRIPAMIFCTTFHLMNSRLFNIGMFPYVCLVTIPLFCKVDWPRKLCSYINNICTLIFRAKDSKLQIHLETTQPVAIVNENQKSIASDETKTQECPDSNGQNKSEDNNPNGARHVNTINRIRNHRQKPTKEQKFVATLLLFHIILQFFLPYSHFITKGYNNWVPGMYGYSWDMMIHTWDTILIVIKVHDNVNDEDYYLDPKVWVQSDRWAKHGDMARQYAFCIKENLMNQRTEIGRNGFNRENKSKFNGLSTNFSIYFDIWCSLNGRFQQRMFDPTIDLLTIDWHPLKPISYLMPLLTQYNSYRQKLDEIQQQVYSWSNDSDVLFVADFPGLHLETYISEDLANVSLTVLEGEVTYTDNTETIILPQNSSIPIKTKTLHKVRTTSVFPACYMYTYNNRSNGIKTKETDDTEFEDTPPLLKEIYYKLDTWSQSINHIANAFFYLVYDVPMVRRVPKERIIRSQQSQ